MRFLTGTKYKISRSILLISLFFSGSAFRSHCWSVPVAALVLVWWGLSPLEAKEPSQVDLDKAAQLRINWLESEENIEILTQLIKDFTGWEEGIDVLTNQPVREVALHSKLRDALFLPGDRLLLEERKKIYIPVFTIDGVQSHSLNGAVCEYWSSGSALNAADDTEFMAIKMSGTRAKGERGISFDQLPASVKRILLHNQLDKPRVLPAGLGQIAGDETVLLYRDDRYDWAVSRVKTKKESVCTNPQVRSDMQLCPLSVMPSADRVPGEYRLPGVYLKTCAETYGAKFCDGSKKLYCYIDKKALRKANKYGVLFRDDNGTHSYMLRVDCEHEARTVRCFVGDSLGYGKAAENVDALYAKLQESYPGSKIAIWYPKYMFQEDFCSCSLFSLAFLNCWKSSRFKKMLNYFSSVIKGRRGLKDLDIEKGIVNHDFPTWLLPKEVQMLIQSYRPDYLYYPEEYKRHDEKEFVQEVKEYEQFLKIFGEENEMPVGSMVDLEKKVRAVTKLYPYNLAAINARYTHLLSYVQSANPQRSVLRQSSSCESGVVNVVSPESGIFSGSDGEESERYEQKAEEMDAALCEGVVDPGNSEKMDVDPEVDLYCDWEKEVQSGSGKREMIYAPEGEFNILEPYGFNGGI